MKNSLPDFLSKLATMNKRGIERQRVTVSVPIEKSPFPMIWEGLFKFVLAILKDAHVKKGISWQ
jgi:hypothetical protein